MPVTLPVELWTRILSFIADDSQERPKLWVSGRAVSTEFKEAIETIFRKKHLPKTFISYDLGTHYLDNDSEDGSDEWRPNKVVLSSNFKFSHISADKSTAFFIDSEIHANFKSLVISNLRFAIDMAQFKKPAQTVQVRHDLNDTPIPGFSIDYDTLTISCDWRGLFSAFFAEEVLANNMCDRAMEKFNPRRDALITDVRAGRMDMLESMKEVLKVLGDETDKARKQARRARIRRQYEQDGYENWQPREQDAKEEEKINKEIKEGIFLAQFHEFSDEDGGDVGDNEDEDRNEDEEWEDEEEDEGDVEKDIEEDEVGDGVDTDISIPAHHEQC